MALARHDKALRKEAVKAMRGDIALQERYVRNAMKSLLVLAKARPPVQWAESVVPADFRSADTSSRRFWLFNILI